MLIFLNKKTIKCILGLFIYAAFQVFKIFKIIYNIKFNIIDINSITNH